MAIDRPVESMTLRELFSAVEFSLRELTAHCGADLLKRYNELEQRVRPGESRRTITSSAIAAVSEQAVKSQEFASEQFQRLDEILHAIDGRAQEALQEPDPDPLGPS